MRSKEEKKGKGKKQKKNGNALSIKNGQ